MAVTLSAAAGLRATDEMNAANILKYFIKKKIVKISEKKVFELSNKVGSDVVLGLEKKNSILFNDGKDVCNFKEGLRILKWFKD